MVHRGLAQGRRNKTAEPADSEILCRQAPSIEKTALLSRWLELGLEPILMRYFLLTVQMFGSPSTPVLENPEYQTRWYFKYFLGKCEYDPPRVNQSLAPAMSQRRAVSSPFSELRVGGGCGH